MRVWLFMLTMTLPALAQPEGPRAEVRERVRQALVQRLVQRLMLDPASAARLNQVVKSYDDQIAAVQMENRRAHMELRQLLDSGRADDATVTQLTNRILSLRGRVRQLEDARLAEVRKLFPPQQYGRFLLVWPQVNKQIHAEVMRAAQPGDDPE
jgi:hypothetical protein